MTEKTWLSSVIFSNVFSSVRTFVMRMRGLSANRRAPCSTIQKLENLNSWLGKPPVGERMALRVRGRDRHETQAKQKKHLCPFEQPGAHVAQGPGPQVQFLKLVLNMPVGV